MKCTRSIARGFILIALLLVSSGCLYIPTPQHSITYGRGMIAQEAIQEFRPGAATRQEILLRFGEPDATLSNQSVFVYTWTRTQGYLFIGGAGGRGAIVDVGHTSLLLMEFDERNCLKRVELTSAGLFSSAMEKASAWVFEKTED